MYGEKIPYTLRIFILSTRWKFLFSFILRPAYPYEKRFWCTLGRQRTESWARQYVEVTQNVECMCNVTS